MPRRSQVATAVTVTLAMTFSAAGSYSLGVLAPFIIPALHLTAAGYSLLTAALYATALLTTARLGRLADRLAGPGALALLLLTASATLLAMSAAGSFAILAAAAALGGLALAAGNPVTNRTVVERFGAGARGFVMGVKQSGVPGAALAAGLLLPPLASALGWQPALRVLAAVPLLAIPLGWLALRGGTGQEGGGRARESAERRRSPILLRLTAYGFAMGAASSFVNSFVALYAVRELAFSRPLAGGAVAAAGAAGIVSRVVWATAGDRWSTERLLAYLAAASLASAVLGTLSSAAHAGWMLWPAVLGLGATALAWNGVGMLALVKVAPAASIGWSSGFMMRGFYVGLLAGPPLYGVLIDRLGFTSTWVAQVAIYAAAVTLTVGWLRSPAAVPAAVRVPPAGSARMERRR